MFDNESATNVLTDSLPFLVYNVKFFSIFKVLNFQCVYLLTVSDKASQCPFIAIPIKEYILCKILWWGGGGGRLGKNNRNEDLRGGEELKRENLV